MYCEHCGTKLDSDSKFCTNCGKSTSEPPVTSISENSSDFSAPVDNSVINDIKADNFIAHSQNEPVTEQQNEIISQSDESSNSSVSSDKFAETENFDVEVIEESPVGKGRRFAAVLLVPFILVFMIIFNLVATVRFSLGGENLKNAFNNIDFAEFLDTKMNNENTVISYVYNLVDDGIKKEYDIKEKNIKRFIEKSELQNYSANIISQYADLLVLGKGKASLTADDVSDFVKDNSKFVEEEFGYKFSKSDYREIEKAFDETDVTIYLDSSTWKKFGFDFRYTYIVIYIVLAVTFIFTALFMIWQSAVLSKNKSLVTGYFAFSFIVVGIITLAPIIPLIIFASSEFTLPFIATNLLSPSIKLFAIIGSVDMLAGIVLSVISKKSRIKKA